MHVFEHHRAFALDVEGQDRIPAKFAHRGAKLAASLGGKHIAMKSFAGKRASDRAIGTDQPEIESELLRRWVGQTCAAARLPVGPRRPPGGRGARLPDPASEI